MDKFSTHRLRLPAAVAVTAIVGTALASAGLAGLRTSGPAAAGQYPKNKVALCHRTHSKKHPWVKIRVSQRALKAHLRHGDYVVDDQHPCPPKAKKKHKQKHKNNAKNNAKAKAKHKSKHKSETKAKPKKNQDSKQKAQKGKSGDHGRGHGKK